MENEAWISWAIRILLSVFVLVVMFVLLRWLKGGAGSWREIWKSLSGALRKQVSGLVVTAGVCMLATLLWPMAGLDTRWDALVNGLLGSAWVLVAAWGLTVASSVLVGMLQWKYDMEVTDNLLARRMITKIRVLQKIIAVIIWLGAAAGILMQFERFRTLGGTLLASAGVMSIILGISAQKTFGSIIAGIQIALSNPISLDDVVIVEGEWGRIEEITLTYVVVRIWDRRRLIVPITYFLEKPFQNWTRKSSDLTGVVTLHVDYETPLEPLREESRRLCKESGPLWDGETCSLQVTEAGTETMTVRIVAGSPDASSAWDLRCLIREGLIIFLRDNYPHSLPRRRVVIAESPGSGEGGQG
jgi:small-conductance mechanosensitive channel